MATLSFSASRRRVHLSKWEINLKETDGYTHSLGQEQFNLERMKKKNNSLKLTFKNFYCKIHTVVYLSQITPLKNIWRKSGDEGHKWFECRHFLMWVPLKSTFKPEFVAHWPSCSLSSWVWVDLDVSSCITKKSSRKMFGTRFSVRFEKTRDSFKKMHQ